MKTLDRIGVIRESLTVFYYGLVSVLPVIGLLPATVALIRGFRLRRAYADPNPADNYRKWGMLLGACSLLLNCYITLIVVVRLIDVIHRGGDVPYDGYNE